MKYSLSRLAATLGLAFSFSTSFAALEFKIPAPNGVGDVVALTNAFATLNRSSEAQAADAKILLSPGVYDLTGIWNTQYSSGAAHLYLNTRCKNALIAGTGDDPGDVILKGSGQVDKKIVLYIWNTSATQPTVVSNLTITGGYRNGDVGGVYGSTYGGLVLKYVNITNNFATGLGAGVLRAKMYNCLIADNRSTGKNGCGFWSDTANTGALDCIFSNNTSTAADKFGGGFYSEKEGGFLIRCKFYNNKAAYGAGAYVKNGKIDDCEFYDNEASVSGGGVYVSNGSIVNCKIFQGNKALNGSGAGVVGNSIVSNCLFKENGPAIGANSTKLGGGVYLSNSECIDCDFIGNYADGGGAIYVSTQGSLVRNCLFEKNRQSGWAGGAAILVNASSPLALVSNCVFNANVTAHSSQRIVANAELVDCVITNNHNINGYLLAGCNMNRCYVADNDSWGDGQNLDIGTAYEETRVFRTNINCVIAFNVTSNGTNAITYDKTVLNCTYYSNAVNSGARIVRSSAAYNSLLVDNKIGNSKLDVAGTQYLTNCVFSASSIAVDASGLSNCKLLPKFRFHPTADGGEYDIKGVSSVFNAGLLEDWMRPLLGARDFAGRERVKFDAVDIGALECQVFPYTAIILR